MIRQPSTGGDPPTVAMIGLGGSADRVMMPGLTTLSGIRLVAACDMDAAVRERAARRWKIPRVYARPGEMLDTERPDIVVVGTPPLTHFDLCLAALQSGSHVFCEKPFMASVEEADQVIALAQQNGRTLAVNNQYYQMPIFRKTQAMLEGGATGRLYHIEAWQHMQLLPHTEGGWKAALAPRRVLYEFGTHALDLMCQFFGTYPVAVTARMPQVRADVKADVCIIMRLDFPGDRVANLVVNRMSYAPRKYLEMRLDCEQAALRVSLGGVARAEIGWNSERARPRIRFSLTQGGEARWEHNGQSRLLARQSVAAFSDAATLHFAQFVAAIREGREPRLSAGHAREVLRAALAGYQSAGQDGEVVRL